MRGTLHLVAASEVPELVRGLGTRLGWQSAVWLRYFKVTKQEMVALQDAIGDLLSDEPMTRQELADALATKLGDPAFADRVTSSWGTFLKPAAGRGLPRLRAGPRPERDVRPPGRVAGHRHPGARRRRLRCRARPPPRGVPGRIEGRARTVVGRRGEPGDRRVQAARRPARPRRPRGHEGVRAGRGRRGAVAAEPEPDSTVRLLGGFDPYTLSLQKEAEPLLPIARRPLVSRTAGWISAVLLSGGAVAGTWTVRVEAQGDDDRAQPVAPAGEGRAGDDRGRGRRRSARSSRRAWTSA